MKKAILIDSQKKTVTEVEVGEGIQDIYKHLNCQAFDAVDLDENVTCYVDDEGLCKDAYIDDDGVKHNMHGFTLIKFGEDSILMGNGLVLGLDPETGESIDSPLSVEQVTKLLIFKEFDKPEARPQPQIQVISWDF